MKKLLPLISALVLSGASAIAIAQDWSEIRIGVEGAYPPFSAVTTSGELRIRH